MHLALLIGQFPPGVVGGAELQAEAWARRLAARHRVTVITRRNAAASAAREERDGFTVLRLPVAAQPLWRTAADLGAISHAVGELSPRPDLLLCFQTFVSGLAGVRAGRRHGIPAVVWIRGEEEYRLGPLGRRRWLNPGIWRDARAVLVQSERGREQLLGELARHAPGVAASVAARLEVVPNGLELPAGPFSPGAGVLGVGRLIPDKGMDVLIDAMARCGGTLTLAGDGPERAALERRARERGVDCRFEGFAGRERLEALYRGAECLVLAARRGEGLPNVVLEAMACARPVIATACAGVAELVLDERTGLVVPPEDPAALAGAISRLRSDPALAARLGGEARRLAERFAWASVLPLLEDRLASWLVHEVTPYETRGAPGRPR